MRIDASVSLSRTPSIALHLHGQRCKGFMSELTQSEVNNWRLLLQVTSLFGNRNGGNKHLGIRLGVENARISRASIGAVRTIGLTIAATSPRAGQNPSTNSVP